MKLINDKISGRLRMTKFRSRDFGTDTTIWNRVVNDVNPYKAEYYKLNAKEYDDWRYSYPSPGALMILVNIDGKK
jgi:hypothetical protein